MKYTEEQFDILWNVYKLDAMIWHYQNEKKYEVVNKYDIKKRQGITEEDFLAIIPLFSVKDGKIQIRELKKIQKIVMSDLWESENDILIFELTENGKTQIRELKKMEKVVYLMSDLWEEYRIQCSLGYSDNKRMNKDVEKFLEEYEGLEQRKRKFPKWDI